jgi:amidase
MPDDLVSSSAVDLASLIRRREVSVEEVMLAHLDLIEKVNPVVNAIVTLLPDQAIEEAREADRILAQGRSPGPLFGLPVAHKDLVETKGIRTTNGSPIFRDWIPNRDALIIERMKRAGAISIGKTNTPEFGAGSQTFNKVFGPTLNPYDQTKTCGGSSGGAAVALACGMLPLADGSDTGGSLRNPASFCNVVGFRTSPGRVPVWPNNLPWSTLSVQGPMARNVADVALLLSVLSGPDARSPIAIREGGGVFAQPLDKDFSGVRVAWSPNLGNLPVDSRVTAVLETQRAVFEELGCVVEEVDFDFSDADEIFKTQRAWLFHHSYGDLVKKHGDQIKETVIWNVEEGAKLTGSEIARAQAKQAELYHRLCKFMETYSFLLLPVVQVPPFNVTEQYVTEINGIPMQTYIDWMKSCYYVSVTGNPAISVPAGFTPEDLPVGLQIVGRHQDDLSVLQIAHAFEQAKGPRRWPKLSKDN